MLVAHGLDEFDLLGQLVTGDGVDEPAVGGQVQPVPGGLAQHRRAPDDPAGVVVAEGGEQPAVVRADVGEAAEDPGRDGGDVALAQHQLALVAVGAPPQQVFAAEAQEHLGGEVQVQVVGHAVGHGRRADVVAVRLAEVDDLLRALRDARADHRVVLLAVRARRAAVDERLRAGDEVAAPDRAAGELLLVDVYRPLLHPVHLRS